VLRDGQGFTGYKDVISEELGDVLWYAASVAEKHDLSLDDIARDNLKKVRGRWRSSNKPGGPTRYLDDRFPPKERFPRTFDIGFEEKQVDGRTIVVLTRNGRDFGDPLTDNSYFEDNYRFHDVFHLAYAAHLGWSPVTRKLLGRKRKSDARVDEIEDGGRAKVIEEGIAAFVFDTAKRHNFFEGIARIDFDTLRLVKNLAANLEVRRASLWDWERAILEGYRVFRILRAAHGGTVRVDLRNKRLTFRRARKRSG
jgi:hypothetical protein